MNEKAGALKNGQLLITLVISVIGAIGGAGGGSYIYFSRLAPSQLEAIARQDKFTGTEGAAIIRRLAALERKVELLPPRELFLTRITGQVRKGC
jgi:hypothetical protein